MKKTILVSIGTTLATMFVVMICMHMCKSHCGASSSCGKATTECGSSYGDGGKCASYTKSCHKKKSCSKSKCSKGYQMEWDFHWKQKVKEELPR